MKVYKIIQFDRIKCIRDYIKGNALPFINYQEKGSESTLSEKDRLESKFEEIRYKEFPNCPSRHGVAFFVFDSLYNETSWLVQMSKDESMKYLLVTIDTDKENVEWFNVDYFDDSAKKEDTEVVEKAKLYWGSRKSEPDSDGLYEGLLQGENKIISCELKYWNHRQRMTKLCKEETVPIQHGELTIDDIDFDDEE